MTLVNPQAQTANLPVPNVFPISTHDSASQARIAITEAFENVKVKWPDALWNPNSHGWESLFFVPATPTPSVPLPPPATHLTPLEQARLQAQADPPAGT